MQLSTPWTALSGGRTNRLWRLSRPGGDIVVKLFSGSLTNPLFPNDPASEVLALAHLATHDIAPKFIDHLKIGAQDCLVYGHLPGQPWQSDAAQPAEALYRLHRTAPPKGLRRSADGSDALRQQTEAILSACPVACAAPLRANEPGCYVPASGRASFLHGDPVPANMVLQGNVLRLIDWQCPAIGDPCEDIAVFLSPAMQLTYRGAILSRQEVSAFLAAYPDQAIIARYRRLAPWYHWRMAAYCLWQECHGDPVAARAGAAELAALHAAVAAQHRPAQLV